MFKVTAWTVRLADGSKLHVSGAYDTDGGPVTVCLIDDDGTTLRDGDLRLSRNSDGQVTYARVDDMLVDRPSPGVIRGTGRSARAAVQHFVSLCAQAHSADRRKAA